MILKPFQENAKNQIIEMLSNNKEEIIMESPTGSGKTVILCKTIEEYLKTSLQDICIVWLTPGAGELEEQSRDKFDSIVESYHSKSLDDAICLGIQKNDVIFINWEQLNKKGNRALREQEKKNFKDRIEEACSNGLKFIAIIDECHKNNTKIAKEILELFINPQKIYVSATIDKKKMSADITIKETDVINAGLITKAIYINEGVNKISTINNEHEFLLQLAIAKQSEIRKEYLKIGKNINPLIIIQYPNKSDTLVMEVEQYLQSLGYDYDNGTCAKWFSDQKEGNLKEIAEWNSEITFLHMKQAISTGWDCTRAKILVKLREDGSESFKIQTIGRIRRMPEQHHYSVDVLNYCYLYTLDEDYKNDVMANFEAGEVHLLYLKKEYKKLDLGLMKELKSDECRIDNRKASRIIVSYYKDKYNCSKCEQTNQTHLESAGYTFDDKIRRNVLADYKVLELNKLEYLNENHATSVYLKVQKDVAYNMYRNTVWMIASKVALPYDCIKSVLQRMFIRERIYNKDKRNRTGELLKLQKYNFYLFVVNNKREIIKDIMDALHKNNVKSRLESVVKKVPFYIPEKDIFHFDTKIERIVSLNSNVYENYQTDIVATRSLPEKQFEQYCDKAAYQTNKHFEWLYKNGDKGQQYLSIIYENNAGKQFSFYPDYIVSVNGRIFIVETKGGTDITGSDKNIDKIKAEEKFNALKRYVTEHNCNNQNNKINWCFVRDEEGIDAFGNRSVQLLYSNTIWTDELDHNIWKPLDTLF